MRSSELASPPSLARLDTACVAPVPAPHDALPAAVAAPPAAADAEQDESPATVVAASPPAAAPAPLPAAPASPPPRRRSSLSPASDALPQPTALVDTLSTAPAAHPISATTPSSSSGGHSASSSRSRSRRADDSSARGTARGGEYTTDSDSLGRSGSWASTTPTSPDTEEQGAELAHKGLLGAEPRVQHAPGGMSSAASGRTIDALHANDLMHERAALRANAARAAPASPASRVPRKSSSPLPPAPVGTSSPLPASSSGSLSSPSQIPVRRGNTPSPGRLLSSPVPPRQATQLAPERPAAGGGRSVSPASTSASSRTSRSTRRAGISAAEMSHRNKPLPSPGQPPQLQLAPALPAPQPPSPSSPLLPDYLVHMYSQEALADAQQAAAAEAAARPSTSNSLAVPSPRPSLSSPAVSASSSTESRHSSSQSPQRPSLRSTISRSSKAFMSSMRGSSSSSREQTPPSAPSRSRSSLTSNASVRPASPVRKVPSDAGHGLSPPPSAPPRPHSSFGFRRKPKTPSAPEIPASFLSRNNTSASASTPPPASGSASVSRKSTVSQSVDAAASAPPAPNRARSRFSQRFSLNDPAWSRAAAAAAAPLVPRARRDVSPPSSIRANVAVEPMSPKRPAIRRLRSSSVDQMQRVYLNAEAQRELGVTHLELAPTSDSQATAQGGTVLRASIIDQEPLLSADEAARLARLSRLPEGAETQIEESRDDSVPQSRRGSRALLEAASVPEDRSAQQSADDEKNSSREKALSRLTGSLTRKPAEALPASSLLAVDAPADKTHCRSRSSASAFSTGPLSPSAAKTYLAALSALKSPQLASRPQSMDPANGPTDAWWAAAEPWPSAARAAGLDERAQAPTSVPASEVDDGATEFEDAASTLMSHSHYHSPGPALGLSLAPESVDEHQVAPKGTHRPSHARSRSSGIGRFLGFSRPGTPEEPASNAPLRASSSLGFSRGVREEMTTAATSAGHSRNASASRKSVLVHSRTSSTGGASDVSYTTALTHPTVVAPATPAPLKRLSRAGRSTLTDPTVASAARARSKVVPTASPAATPSPPSAQRLARKQATQPPSSYHSPTPPQSPKAATPPRSASAMGMNDSGSAAAKMRSPLRALVTRSAHPPPANKPYMVVDRVPVVTPPRRSSMEHRAASPEADTAVSDTEDADLQLPRRRSQSRQADVSPATPGVRARNRPSLSIHTQPEALVHAGRRSASNEVRTQPPTPVRAMPRRKSSAATLNIADDREFLEALEDVRRHHQDRIARRGAEKLQQGVGSLRQAMASTGNLLTKRSTQTSPVEVRMPTRPRSASVDGKMPPFLASQSPAESFSSGDSGLATPLERGVGMASGRMHDGAFVNDADWKREVSSLFVIREMVQTERSYARHLESLLQAVRRVSATSTASPSTHRRRRSSSALMMSTVDVPLVGPAPHIATLRTMLPQLIALSRTLATRIDENPTAAGVGAAFRLVAPQLEATFVSWAGVVGDVMESLRLVENGKAKSKDRIGLVMLMPVTAGELVPRSSNVSAASLAVPRSQRAGPNRSVALDALALTRPSTPEGLLDEPLLPSPEEDFAPRPNAAKRRSTISSGTFLAAPAPISPAASSPASRVSPARSPSPWGFASPATTLGRRAMDAVTRPAAPAKNKAQTGVSAAKSLAPADIVIQPTQRIARYQLLLNALQRNTPPQSLSHARIQRALEVVGRVAGLCNTASLPAAAAAASPLHLSPRPPLSYPSTAPATAATSVASDIDVPPAVPPRLRAVS